jgi:hypothetical protein
MAQFARPGSDISTGTWTTSSGGSTALFDELNESVFSDVDYVQSGPSPNTDTLEIALGSITDPAVGTGHTVRYRIGKTGTDSVDLTVSLRQGASTEIVSWTHINVATGPTTVTQTLTAPQADAISNYGTLRLRFVASSSTALPPGIYMTDADGSYLVDADGAYLTET